MALKELRSGQNYTRKSERIAVNTLVLFLRMLVLTVVNLYSVRIVLHGLGVVDYGIYNAIAALVTASTAISSTLAMATQRFYSYAIGEGNETKLRQIFTASMGLCVFLTFVIIVLLAVFGPWFISTKMTIPAVRLHAALWVFILTSGAFCFSLFQIPFLAAVFAHEQMTIYALISTMDCLLKLLLAFMLLYYSDDRLIFYGAGILIVATMVFLSYLIYARKHYAECHLQHLADHRLVKNIISFSGWTFYGTLTSMATIQGSALILNVFFGPLANTAFSVSNQIYNALNALAGSTTTAFRPAMIKAYSSNEHIYLNKLFSASNKLLFYLLLLVAVPVCVETWDVLTMWLGKASVSQEMVDFCRLYIIYTLLLSLQNPITIIIQATGRMRNYELIVETVILLSIPLTLLLFHSGYAAQYLLVSLIICCCVSHIFRLIILHQQYPEFQISDYVLHFVVPALIITAIGLASALMATYINIDLPILRLLVVGCVSSVFIFACTLSFGVNREEKLQTKKLLYNLKKKF